MDKGENPQPTPLFKSPKMKISDIKQMIMIWPANILANNRMINANGLVKMPRNSTNTRIGLTPTGTGGLKTCFQKCELLLKRITIKEITPKTNVKAILPVTFAVPGIRLA